MSKLRPVIFVCLAAMLGACSTAAPEFSWFHPQGGEYLFAFDSDECRTEVAAQGTTLGTDTSGPFFSCMHARGYFLVSGDRIVQAPTAVDTPTASTD